MPPPTWPGETDVGALCGLLFGVGALLAWQAFTRTPRTEVRATPGWLVRRGDLLRQAGVDGVGSTQLFAVQLLCAVVLGLLVLIVTSTITIALCFGGFAFFAPVMLLR